MEFPPTTEKDKRNIQALEIIKYYVWDLFLRNYVGQPLPNMVTINYYCLVRSMKTLLIWIESYQHVTHLDTAGWLLVSRQYYLFAVEFWYSRKHISTRLWWWINTSNIVVQLLLLLLLLLIYSLLGYYAASADSALSNFRDNLYVFWRWDIFFSKCL